MKKHFLPAFCLLTLTLPITTLAADFPVGEGLLLTAVNPNTPTQPNILAEQHQQPISTKSVHGRQKQSRHLQKRAVNDMSDWARDYNRAKQEFTNATGISYTIDASYLGQRGAPNGKITPWQSQYYGTANWDMFNSETWGDGSLQIAYTLVRYWNKNASILGQNIGVMSGINDYTEKANYFDQLSYTHVLPGDLNWLSLTVGQFPMYNFDGTTYNSNQQLYFVNEALSQNLTDAYPSAGLGGYLTISPNSKWSFSAGLQDATNVSGDRITTKNWGDKRFTSFVSATYNPTNKLGDATIGVLLYNQPSVEAQPGNTNGWSFNFQQNIGKKTAVFARVNGVGKGINGYEQSYVLGGVYNNPLNRNALDQIGLAGAVNKLNKAINGENSRSVENVLEAYWSWGISSFITITPDVQFYINPALNRKSNTATVASIRATLMF